MSSGELRDEKRPLLKDPTGGSSSTSAPFLSSSLPHNVTYTSGSRRKPSNSFGSQEDYRPMQTHGSPRGAGVGVRTPFHEQAPMPLALPPSSSAINIPFSNHPTQDYSDSSPKFPIHSPDYDKPHLMRFRTSLNADVSPTHQAKDENEDLLLQQQSPVPTHRVLRAHSISGAYFTPGVDRRESSATKSNMNNRAMVEHHHHRSDTGNEIRLSKNEVDEIFFDFDPDFDTSAPHLMKLFNTLDKDGNGRLTYDELREGLLSMRGLHELPPVKVNQIIQQIDKDESHDISQEEFVFAVQHLATKALRRPTNLVEFFVYDYGPDMAVCRWIYSQGQQGGGMTDEAQLEVSLDEFFSEPVDVVSEGNVRWISMTGVDPSIVIRLANKYKLHPLQVEDVIGTDKERMKVDWSSKVLQIVVGRAVLTETATQPKYLQIKKEQVTIFLINDQTVISIQKSPSTVNNVLLARIMYAGSKIRLNGPRFLAYAIVDSIVDELFPIMRMLRKKLKSLHSDVTSMSRTQLSTVHYIQHIIREVNLLQLWLSPLSAVVTRLVSELPSVNLTTEMNVDMDLKRHLEDLVDHMHALKEQTSSMVDWAKSLNDEYLNEQQYRMNQVIYILTMVTIVCLPAQFFSSLFGMNFEHMPLIHDTMGFYFFWMLTFGVSSLILVVFRLKQWL